MQGNMFMVSAPSGAGKSSLVNALLKQDANITLSISCTTRQPRPGEQDGREYYFLTPEAFLEMRDRGDLLEWAEVHGNYYGTPKPPLIEALKQGRDVLLEIDYQGAQQVRQSFPEVTSVFILPPSLQSLKDRLTARQQDSEAVIQKRLLAANNEIQHANEAEYVIINDNFDIALKELQQIFQASRLKYPKQATRHADLFHSFNLL